MMRGRYQAELMAEAVIGWSGSLLVTILLFRGLARYFPLRLFDSCPSTMNQTG